MQSMDCFPCLRRGRLELRNDEIFQTLKSTKFTSSPRVLMKVTSRHQRTMMSFEISEVVYISGMPKMTLWCHLLLRSFSRRLFQMRRHIFSSLSGDMDTFIESSNFLSLKRFYLDNFRYKKEPFGSIFWSKFLWWYLFLFQKLVPR